MHRRWLQPFDQQLPAATRWAKSLPVDVQPLGLLQTFPRIANALARLWKNDLERQMYLDDLLADRRGGRQGFPPDVQYELLVLWEYAKSRRPTTSSST